jgi:hypothetical protein
MIAAGEKIMKRLGTGIGVAMLWAALAAPGYCQTVAGATTAATTAKMQYLVEAVGGPGFATPQETVTVLEGGILPGFDYLQKLLAAKTIVAGGLPVGERSFVFIIEASSNDEADRIIRGIPFWGVLQWKVTPLESFADRAATERQVLTTLKGSKP